MHRSFRVWLILGGLVVGCAGARLAADSRRADFGAFVQSLLDDRSEELFGIGRPLDHSAVGPFDGPSVDALELAPGLKATLVSSAVENAADQIALWPDDDHPTHLFVCDEETSSPGTIIVAEEHGIDGGLYEILDPVHITTAIAVTNRATERFIAGSQQLGMPDNVAFQPHTGNLVVLEDGPTSIVRADGTTQPRGNDLWICLPTAATTTCCRMDASASRRCAIPRRSRAGSSSSGPAKRRSSTCSIATSTPPTTAAR